MSLLRYSPNFVAVELPVPLLAPCSVLGRSCYYDDSLALIMVCIANGYDML